MYIFLLAWQKYTAIIDASGSVALDENYTTIVTLVEFAYWNTPYSL